jgi:hypothetical protein
MARLAALLALGALLVAVPAVAAGPTKHECVVADDAAQDLRGADKLREAREKLAVCVSQSCPGPVRVDCAKRLSEIDGVMPSLVFEAKDGSGNDLSAIKVTMDGQPLADKLDGRAIEVDPGEHHFAFDDADGLTHAEKTLVVHEGDKDQHVSVVVRGASATAPAAATSSAAASPSDGSTQRTMGLVVGGVGVAGVVVGSIFGGMALSGSPCSSNNKTCATQADHDTLVAHETIANIGLGVGLVGLVVGGYLFLTAHPRASTTEPASASIAPWIGWGTAGIAGTFR